MATLKLSGLISDIRGKFNGSQFSKNRSAALLQNKGQQVRFATGAQNAKRSVFGYAARYWRSLTPAQQAENSANAVNYPYVDKYGDTRYYTGYQLLLRSNINRINLGLPPINVVPETPPQGVVSDSQEPIAQMDYLGLGRVFFIDWSQDFGNFSATTAVLYLSPAVSAGNSSYSGKTEVAGTSQGSDGDIQVTGVDVPFVDTWITGRKVFYWLVFINTATGIQVAEYSGSTIII